MRSIWFISVFALGVMMSFASQADAQRKSVSGVEVTGTFRMNFKGKFKDSSNEIKIQALGGGRLRVAMDLIYPYTMTNGEPMVHMGTLDGEASIEADEAVYSGEDGKCRITIKFVRPGTIRVDQQDSDSDCGFGHNVVATGTYRKVSGKKPNFEATQ